MSYNPHYNDRIIIEPNNEGSDRQNLASNIDNFHHSFHVAKRVARKLSAPKSQRQPFDILNIVLKKHKQIQNIE